MDTESLLQGHVVVGVDESEHAMRAAGWAAAEAAARRVPLHVVHALTPEPSYALMSAAAYGEHVHAVRQAADALLETVRARAVAEHPGLTVATEAVDEGAAAALVGLSRGAGLLVVGSRGHGGFAGLALGSVSTRVVAHAHCPAVVLRPEADADPYADTIVLGMQAGEAQDAILFAFAEAARTGAILRVVHGWIPYPSHAQDYLSETDILALQARDRMAADLAPAREKFPDVRVRFLVRRGHPSFVLAEASREARLTVVGAHRRLGPLSLGVGPVIHGLLGHAHSPVAVVPVH
jgi:nucleotide-binding universal stress UspA family protein